MVAIDDEDDSPPIDFCTLPAFYNINRRKNEARDYNRHMRNGLMKQQSGSAGA